MEGLNKMAISNQGHIPQVLPALVKAIGDSDDGVARRAGFGFYQITQQYPAVMKDQVGYLNQALSFALNQGGNPNFDSYNPFVSVVNCYTVIAEHYPENLYSSIPLINKCVNYPVYHPENPHWGLDQLYASAIRTIGLIGVKRPDLVSGSVLFLTRCLSDSFKYTFFLNQNPGDPNSLLYCVGKALDGIGFANPGTVIPLMIKALNDQNQRYASYSKEFLNRLFDNKTAKVIPPSILVYADENLQIQERAREITEEWGKRAPQAMVPALVNCFQNPAPPIRQNATKVIGEVGKFNPAFVQNYLKVMCEVLVNDSEKDVRQAMADALFKVAEVNLNVTKQFAPYYVRALKDDYHHVRWRIAQLVGLIGEKDAHAIKDGLPILMEMYRDQHEHVRWRAEEAVKQIGIDKSEYLMAMKSIQQVRVLMEENKKRGIGGFEEQDLLDRAKASFQNMLYKDAISFTDQAKVLIVGAMKEYKSKGRGGTPTMAAGQPLQPIQAEQVVTDAMIEPPSMGAPEMVPLQDEFKFCPYCGTKNQGEYNFCMKCQKPLPQL